ncbi:hypothetical protein CHLRE_12g546200v5 [Chlamydomonas reinhardtii]|uniref:Peptidase S54 rhomboid domain-containing protein n=1 Tax=Chlamydomonas reinhardtii TaxID=3055 RepID=A0A2K3D6I7_CHLRE|nr:uncharacterized protein CHLRE_12g546200v5 [Chlamydomonas reinhardtii]PNW76140.1 hypothetical protein CHLRE_12g546200v5 [Chlamydomonas reinhardtii]
MTGLTGSGSSSSTSSSGRGTAAAAAALPEDLRSPSYAIATANAVMFLACALVPLLPASAVLLNHKAPQIWQLLTSSFAHPSLESVMQCVFFTYVFGRVVERNHGVWTTWAVYIACGATAAALAWWLIPAKAGLLTSAAPAAAWGLFLVGVGIPRLAKKPLEVACLAPFAFAATTGRYAHASAALLTDGTAVGHLVHVVGAGLAAALASCVIHVVEGILEARERKRLEEKRQPASNSSVQ